MSRNRMPYPTRDGYIALLPYTTAQWTRVLNALGREDITSAAWFQSHTERSKRSDELYQILAGSLGHRTSAEWLEVFEGLDVPCGPVHSLSSVLDDPHLRAVGFFEPGYETREPYLRTLRQPVLWRGVENRPDRRPPALGADARGILAEIGVGDAEMAALVDKGIVVAPKGSKA
jgi:crotonobetainyl-CoA:carnitine CoA-transferase CaiB-like acyl-CoA transferase